MNDALLAITLGLFSAVTLAAANVSVKMGSDILAGRAILSASAAVLIAPAALFVAVPDAATARALALAVPAHFFYQLCLVQAMKRGDLSLVFPIMRGAAPLLTAVAAMVLLAEYLPWTGWAGLAVATVALLGFAMPPRGVAMHMHPDRASLGWALATAVGVALYNVVDARGVRIAPDPMTYIVWLFLIDWICITATALVLRRQALVDTLLAKWRFGVAAGALSIASFGAALYAYSIMDVAKVSALRETSVVFAALFGGWLLHESFGRRRTAAAVVLAGGLVLMQFG